MASARAKTKAIVVGGGGTIGSSTALHFIRSGYTPSKITIIDTYPFPSVQSADKDLNKIIDIRVFNKAKLQLAVWDPNLSLEQSLEYGYTRLQLMDALAMSSISISLRYQTAPGRSDYPYGFPTIATVAQTVMTCDVSSSSYYGPCHITILVQ